MSRPNTRGHRVPTLVAFLALTLLGGSGLWAAPDLYDAAVAHPGRIAGDLKRRRR